MSTPSPAPDYQWFHDMGFIHHVTNELSKLNVRADDYIGPNHLQVGDGQGLKILHTGLANLPSNNQNFCLSSLLHVPQIKKNLMSINSPNITMFSLKLIPIFSVSRIFQLAHHCSIARVEQAYIHGLSHRELPLDLLLIMVRKHPWIHGTKGCGTLLHHGPPSLSLTSFTCLLN
jgi:hypothetical protein